MEMRLPKAGIASLCLLFMDVFGDEIFDPTTVALGLIIHVA
jgi:hypothetical protein